MTTTQDQTMTVETYEEVRTEDAVAQMEHDSLMDEYDQRETLCQALGLTKQVEQLAVLKLTRQYQQTIPFQYMNAKDYRIWKWYLPTSYGSQQYGDRQLADYRYDLIPFTVLTLWQEVKQSNIFDQFEIWTPERVRPDPILVGYKEDDKAYIGPWLIARWGESLKSFEEIRAEVEKMATPDPTNVAFRFNSFAAQQLSGLNSLGNAFSVMGRGNF